MNAFKNGDKVQALDPVLGQRLSGTVLDVADGGVLIHWTGFTSYFDARLDTLEVQKTEGERSFHRRRPMSKSNFSERQHPKHCRRVTFSVCITTAIGLRQKWW